MGQWQKTKENTFNGTCRICGRKNTPVHMHHLVPQRLLKRLDVRHREIWEKQRIEVCNSCDAVLHPENKLYEKIIVLESKLKEVS